MRARRGPRRRRACRMERKAYRCSRVSGAMAARVAGGVNWWRRCGSERRESSRKMRNVERKGGSARTEAGRWALVYCTEKRVKYATACSAACGSGCSAVDAEGEARECEGDREAEIVGWALCVAVGGA